MAGQERARKYQGFAKAIPRWAATLGVQRTWLTPLMHDARKRPAIQPHNWKKGECEPIPARPMPKMTVVERRCRKIHEKFTSIGPLLEKVGNGGKGIGWRTGHEVDVLAA